MAQAGGVQDITNSETEPTPAGAAAQPRVADMLRTAREAAGLDIKQLALLTRVTSRHLEALENGDYAALPGRPYALGFAKSYARAVNLDPVTISEAVRAELDRQAPAPPPRVINQFEVGDPAKTPTRLTSWVAAGLVIAIALAGLAFWRSYYLPSAELPSLVGPEEARPVASQTAVVPLPSATPSGPVVFTATQERIWVKLYDGAGKQILQKELAMGESFTVPADAQKPMLWTARPDALNVTIGGQAVPKLAEREGIMKVVPVDAQALLARAAAPAPAVSAPVASSSASSSASSATGGQAAPVSRPAARRSPTTGSAASPATRSAPNEATVPPPVPVTAEDAPASTT